MSKTIVLIPARLESTRLPRKMLLAETGKPLIQHTYENAAKAGYDTWVVTDSDEIAEIKGINAVKTPPANSGTERIAWAITNLFNIARYSDAIINVQGDEPLINPQHIKTLAEFRTGVYGIATLCTNWRGKAKCSDVGVAYFQLLQKAVYFTRRPQQGLEHKHIGIYAYSANFLADYSQLKIGPFETNTKLEQFRALENSIVIGCKQVDYDGISIDTREDYEEFKRRMKDEN